MQTAQAGRYAMSVAADAFIIITKSAFYIAVKLPSLISFCKQESTSHPKGEFIWQKKAIP